jgi:hypothetical protein
MNGSSVPCTWESQLIDTVAICESNNQAETCGGGSRIGLRGSFIKVVDTRGKVHIALGAPMAASKKCCVRQCIRDVDAGPV